MSYKLTLRKSFYLGREGEEGMRYRGKRAFRLLRVSRAGFFSDLSAGDTCPLRIPVTQLLNNNAYQGAWMSGKGLCLFCRNFRDGLRFPPQISHEETAPFRQSYPKNPLAPIPDPLLSLWDIWYKMEVFA